MALFLELVSTIILLVSKPFSLLKISCIFVLRIISIITSTWVELLRAAVNFHVTIFWRLFVWTVALISLPVQFFTAFRRERLLAMHLHEMQNELEELSWRRKDLEERLQTAIKERRMMDIMLSELEEEHDQAIGKIELLEGELQDVKTENLRLKEIQGKSHWSSKNEDYFDNDPKYSVPDKKDIPYGMSSMNSGYDGSGMIFQELLMHKDHWEDESKSKMELSDFLKTGLKARGSIHPFNTGIISKSLDVNDVLVQQREVAMSQSLFSAVLSLLVGMIVWEAEDPCMPLVVALLTVVGISLRSVIHFFSTIKNRPAADAVSLLSVNWFILGTLTYPTLPRVTRILTPWVLIFSERAMKWLGFSF